MISCPEEVQFKLKKANADTKGISGKGEGEACCLGKGTAGPPGEKKDLLYSLLSALQASSALTPWQIVKREKPQNHFCCLHNIQLMHSNWYSPYLTLC